MSLSQLLSINERKTATKFLLLAAVMWSTGGLFIKLVDWNPMAIGGVRGLIATLTVWAVVPKVLFLPNDRFFWLASVAYAGLCLCMVTATKLTTAANAIFLQYTAPIYVALISAFLLKEKITLLDLGVIASTACGIALFFSENFRLPVFGATFLELAAVSLLQYW